MLRVHHFCPTARNLRRGRALKSRGFGADAVVRHGHLAKQFQEFTNNPADYPANFKRPAPVMISAIPAIRSGVAGSANQTIPKIAAPTAPMPTQTV